MQLQNYCCDDLFSEVYRVRFHALMMHYRPSSPQYAVDIAEAADLLVNITGHESFNIIGLSDLEAGAELTVKATSDDGETKEFKVKARVDSPVEVEYLRNGGILHTVLRQMLKEND